MAVIPPTGDYGNNTIMRRNEAQFVSVAFSPEAKYLAAADANSKAVYIVSVERAEAVRKIPLAEAPTSVAWWRDRVAVGTEEGSVYIYSVNGGEEAKRLAREITRGNQLQKNGGAQIEL